LFGAVWRRKIMIHPTVVKSSTKGRSCADPEISR
jgi:hypothetical protein